MESNASTPHSELIDIALLEDAAQRAGSSGRALFEYYSRLDALRDIADEIGRDALAERAARAELHMRVFLSAGLDALNELHDLGLLEHGVRAAMEDPSAINGTTPTEAVRLCAEVLTERFPDQQWAWLEDASTLLADVYFRMESDGDHLRVTLTQNDQQTVMRLSPDAGVRTDSRAFFSDGPDRIYTPSSAVFAPAPESTTAVTAYDSAITSLALVRELAYRHARNANEIGAPERTGSGAVVAIGLLALAGTICALGWGILQVICDAGHDRTTCDWAKALKYATIGFYLSAVGVWANNSSSNRTDPNRGTDPSFQLGTNPP